MLGNWMYGVVGQLAWYDGDHGLSVSVVNEADMLKELYAFEATIHECLRRLHMSSHIQRQGG